MKMTSTIIIALLAIPALAQNIQGTLMLKGALKSKIIVDSVKTTCKLKVEKVSNLLLEDDFGNPAYKSLISISLDGSDFERSIRVKMNQDYVMTNLFTENSKKIVKDFEYADNTGKVKLIIDENGHLVETTFPYKNQNIRCTF